MKMDGEKFPNNCIQNKQIRVYGIVQGVGFRPFVSRIADRIGIGGSVANRGSYVEIFARGNEAQLDTFLQALRAEAPERSAILRIQVRDLEDEVSAESGKSKDSAEKADARNRLTDYLIDGFPSAERENTGQDNVTTKPCFRIIESRHEEGHIFVSPDIATCPTCKRELFDPQNRRYLHPFINCTACGPRLTILDAMPYDRERTSMKEFPLCPLCEKEYVSPDNRRYDAQPVCCNDCGPEVYLLQVSKEKDDAPALFGQEAISMARSALAQGKIIAVKGIGGFHLCCDATNEAAVSRLRRLKHRPAKPFAVMLKDLDTVWAFAQVTEAEAALLDGHQKPIILLEKRENSPLAESVAPGNPRIGVMLPYAPVQLLLFAGEEAFSALVMTSGNASGAPICRTDEDAIREIGAYCDLILSHNRAIRLRADDSVMSFYEDEPYMIRRSRGYAPLPVMLSAGQKGKVLAVGGELKNTFCIGKDGLFYPSPYVGDMQDVRTVAALSESIGRMEELLEVKPELVVCDMHPDYNTTVVAQEQKLPRISVQHHFAHILSCMAENDLPAESRVIGVAFDGTGYGADGSIWGGEILLSSYKEYQRVGSICPFLQIGGDAAAKEGWRIGVALIQSLFPEEAAEMIARLGLCDAPTQKLYQMMAKKGINTVTSTSVGRLFDAVSAILGIRLSSTFEGEAAMALQFCAEDYAKREEEGQKESGLIWERTGRGGAEHRLLLPTDRLIRYLIRERLNQAPVDRLAYEFHLFLARQVAEACRQVAEERGVWVCALSGGVFQNQLLLRLCEEALTEKGLRVYRHHLIPPNDGGLALGQAVYGMMRLQAEEDVPVRQFR